MNTFQHTHTRNGVEGEMGSQISNLRHVQTSIHTVRRGLTLHLILTPVFLGAEQSRSLVFDSDMPTRTFLFLTTV